VCLKASGLIQGPNIKNVWLTCKMIRIIFNFYFFSSFLVFNFFSFIYLFILLLHTMNECRHKMSQLIFLLVFFFLQ